MIPITTTLFVEKRYGRLVRYRLHTTPLAMLTSGNTWPKVGQTLALECHMTYLKSGQVSIIIHDA